MVIQVLLTYNEQIQWVQNTSQRVNGEKKRVRKKRWFRFHKTGGAAWPKTATFMSQVQHSKGKRKGRETEEGECTKIRNEKGCN